MSKAGTLLPDDAIKFQMSGQDVPWLLQHWAKHRSHHPALIWAPRSGEDRTWTYQELHDDVRSLAGGLSRRGLSVGDKVIVHCENSPEMVLAVLACAAIGAVAVTTNTKSTAAEMAYFANHTGAVAAITQPQFVDLLLTSAPGLKRVISTDNNSGELIRSEELPGDVEPFSALFAGKDEFPERAPNPMLAFSIMFTSGTTSRPKAVVHTHANALWAARTGPRNIDLRADDVYLIYLPLFHVNALNWSLFSVLGIGATAVLMPKWSKTHFWPVATRCGATHLSMTTFVIPVLSDPSRPPNRLRAATFGRDLPGLAAATGLDIYTAFGMTETVTHALGAKPAEHGPLRSIGRALPGYEVAIINQDSGALCEEGEPGELWIRGTRGIQLFLEYFNDAEANAKAFQDGWFRTGDIVSMIEGGVIVYQERDKDLLKVGGENVSAVEVETRINALPGVSATAVVGRSHPFLDQVVVAFVIPAPDAGPGKELVQEILEDCRANLSTFKVPRAVHLVEAFPLGMLDKLLKNRLREMAEELPLLED